MGPRSILILVANVEPDAGERVHEQEDDKEVADHFGERIPILLRKVEVVRQHGDYFVEQADHT